MFFRHSRVKLIELKERLDVIADEADGNDDDVLRAAIAETLDFVFEIRLQPGQRSIARLISERPWLLEPFCYRRDGSFDFFRIRVAQLHDLQR